MRCSLLLCLLFILPVLCESPHKAREHNHWRQIMERRQPLLQKMNPHEHFNFILGDVHILMQAGKRYSCSHKGVDVFGSPLVYEAHQNPRFHIFNSDFDPRIQDVYLEGDRALIRTSHPDHLLNVKLRKGYIFSTAMDWTQSEEEVHHGSLDLLITEAPVLVAPNVIMLENVVKMNYTDLWNELDIAMSVQHYQYTYHNGSTGNRAAPMEYTVIDSVETSHDLAERGLFGWIKTIVSNVVQVLAPVTQAVTNVVKAVVQVASGGVLEESFQVYLNYDPNTKRAALNATIFQYQYPKTNASSSPAKTSSGSSASASASASISLTVKCTNCYGIATFRTSSRIKWGLTNILPVFEVKLDGEIFLKTELEFQIKGKLELKAEVPVGPAITGVPKSAAVSGKSTEFDVKIGLFVTASVGVELSGTLKLTIDTTLEGYVSAGLQLPTVMPKYAAFFWPKKVSASLDPDTEIAVKWSLGFGPKIVAKLAGSEITATAGVVFDNTIKIWSGCRGYMNGTESAVKTKANLEVKLPGVFSYWLTGFEKEWLFSDSTVSALIGCFLGKNPALPASPGSTALPPATAIQTQAQGGQVLSFANLIKPTGQYYSITSNGHRYDFNIGSPVTNSPCGGTNVGICQTHVASGMMKVVGVFNRDVVTNDDGSSSATYYNGEYCPNGRRRQGSIVMQCDSTALSPRVDSVREVRECVYEIYVKTANACPIPCEAFAGKSKWDFTPLKDVGPFSYNNNGTTYTVALCGGKIGYCENAGACAQVPMGTLPRK